MEVEHRLFAFEKSIVPVPFSVATLAIFRCALVLCRSSTLPSFCDGPDAENCVVRGVFPGTKCRPPVLVWSKNTGRLGARRFITERRISMMKTRAVGVEVKVQSSSAAPTAKRLGGRIRRRVSTAARQALCGFVLVLSERRAQEAVRTARIDRWR
jgi:hypothetical protein